jgi:glutamate synthase (NADPH) large chain
VLGPTGRNFGAGMSGGIAFVYDVDGVFSSLVNYEMVALEPLDEHDVEWLRETVERHHDLTESAVAARLLANWPAATAHFRKVVPQDYKRVLEVMHEAAALGLSDDETAVKVMEAAHG